MENRQITASSHVLQTEWLHEFILFIDNLKYILVMFLIKILPIAQ